LPRYREAQAAALQSPHFDAAMLKLTNLSRHGILLMTPVSKDALWTRVNSAVAMIDYDNYRYGQTNPMNRHVQ